MPCSIAEAPHAGQELARPDDHPARALQHRLDEHRGDRRRRGSAASQRRPSVGRATDRASVRPARPGTRCRTSPLEAERTAVAVRRVRADDVEQHRRERPREDRVLAGRHRADGVAVIGVVQRDERAARAGRGCSSTGTPASSRLRRRSIRCRSRTRASARAAAPRGAAPRAPPPADACSWRRRRARARAPGRRALRSAADASARGCSPTTTRCRRAGAGRPRCTDRRLRRARSGADRAA